MNKRRDQLKAMMTPIAVPSAPLEDRPHRTPIASGSLKAMGLSLQSLSADADEARLLRAQIASGAQVVDLDPNLIDPSFIRDRLDEPAGEEFDAFVARLAEDGQQVPILVRPCSDKPGRYQSAYGHRRVAALRALGRNVRAIVRQLSDEELIVAQGKENSDRQDLSFIERALFAARLEGRGFSRSAVMAALSLQKGNLSTMMTVARDIPEELILAIGSAPKVGRPRWEQLAAVVKQAGEKWREPIGEDGFASVPSDVRFERVLKALLQRPKKTAPSVIKTPDGKQVARLEQTKQRVRLTIEDRYAPDFGAYLVDQLPEIYAAFRRREDA